MAKSRWGILGTAGIARKQLIPALRDSDICDVTAVASRNLEKARAYALENGIGKAYGTYEELLKDPEIDIIYIPLPNHLHTTYIRACVEAGKHVLCEKPLSLTSEEARELIALRDSSGIMIGEAYAMYHQSRLIQLKQLIDSGEYGVVQYAHGVFYLTNSNPDNIRNNYAGEGGGSLWDIGVYPIAVGRYLFGEEPDEASCIIRYHETFKVDHQTTGSLHFPSGKVLSFGCGMSHPLHTHMSIYTDTHRIEIPRTYFSGPEEGNCYTVHDEELSGKAEKVYHFAAENQYQNECEAFHRAVYEGTAFTGSLENTVNQARTIEALFRAAETGKNERV